MYSLWRGYRIGRCGGDNCPGQIYLQEDLEGFSLEVTCHSHSADRRQKMNSLQIQVQTFEKGPHHGKASEYMKKRNEVLKNDNRKSSAADQFTRLEKVSSLLHTEENNRKEEQQK